MKRYPKAIIFDLDGVITDTGKLHFLAWKKLAEELGIELDDSYEEKLKGISRMDSLELILNLKPSLQLSDEVKASFANKKNDHYKSLISTMMHKDILPGIEDFINAAKSKNIKLGLASASKNAPAVLEKLGLMDTFDHVVDVTKIKKGKPDPEIFLTAAKNLNLHAENCIGVEDARAGIEAIKQAKMFAIGIGSKDVLEQADIVYENTLLLKFDEIIDKYQTVASK